MNISSYEDLLNAANAQPTPQYILFVFAKAELPGGHTRDQQDRFKAQKGGALTPVMCVDKPASERCSFATLVEESRQMDKDWDMVFVACMSRNNMSGDNAADARETELPLKSMVKSIREGKIGNYLTFNRAGELVRLTAA